MFFEIGLVLLMPVILLVARRSGLPLMRVAIPALAGLSAMHGFVPPHPGPLAAVGALNADLGLTLGLGVLVAVPTVIVAGPLFSRFAARWADVPVPELFLGSAVEEPARLEPARAGTGSSVVGDAPGGTPTTTGNRTETVGNRTGTGPAVGSGTGAGSVAAGADNLTAGGPRSGLRRPSFGV